MTATRQRLGEVEVSTKQLAGAVRIVKPLSKGVHGEPKVHLGCELGDLYVEAGTSFDHGRVFIDAQISSDLDAVVAIGDLEAALKGAAPTIAIRVTDDGVEVTSARRTVTLHDLADEDFVGLDYDARAKLFHGGPEAIDRLRRAATHASDDDTRPVLTGTYVRYRGDRPTEVVATDSYRLFVADLPGREYRDSGPHHGAFELLLNTKLLGMALRTITAGNGFDLYDAGTHAIIDTGVTQWRTQKIVGQFPNYEQLLPEGFQHAARISRAALLAAVTAAARLLSANQPVRLHLDDPRHVTVEVAHAGQPRSVEEVDWSGLDPEPDVFQIGLNALYLISALKALGDDDEVELKVISPLRPVLWIGANAQVLLMPIRLNV